MNEKEHQKEAYKKKYGRDRTLGSICSELLTKDSPTDTIWEQANWMAGENGEEFVKYIMAAVESGKKAYRGDFFIQVILKRDKFLPNFSEKRYFTRKSCPLPQFDQTVYRYIKKDDNLELLWTLPDIHSTSYFMLYPQDVHPSDYQSLQYVLDFKDGKLFALSERFNKK